MRFTRVALLCLAVSLVAVPAWRWLGEPEMSPTQPRSLQPFTRAERPHNGRHLFDYAGVLDFHEEGAHRYLERLLDRYHIEALIVTLPALPEHASVESLANDLFNAWRVGAEQEGRGLLLLLIDDAKTAKLEVGYALEDVFTDAFTGFVEDMQLGPNYSDDNLGVGLIAVMELLEARAEIRQLGSYTPGQIARADAALLAGGAGARRTLAGNPPVPASTPDESGQGARSPAEAWETMLLQWGGGGGAVDIDIYTAMTRLAMGDPGRPDARTRQALDHWRNADYEVLRDGDHAVIWFGAREGWNNAPFLFCNTGAGWKFDIVHQRRLVVMAEAPRWQITQGPYPYVALMEDARQTTSKDLPLEGDDLYRCSDDAAIAARMRALDTELARDPDDLDAVMESLRLNVITGQRPNRVRPLIQRAKKLAPDAPETYKYAAIYDANTFFQYETALEEMARYQALRADDAFGYRMQGFLLYRLGRYAASIDALERAAGLDPESSYAYALMARNYALLARRASAVEKRRLREDARDMWAKAGAVAAAGDMRLQWLNRWLEGRI